MPVNQYRWFVTAGAGQAVLSGWCRACGAERGGGVPTASVPPRPAPAWTRRTERPATAGQPITVTPSGTFPTVIGAPTVPVETVTGTVWLTLESTTHAVLPSGLKPTA